MAGASSAREIKCTAKIGGQSRYVSGFNAVIAVNNFWPKITLETHQKKEAHSKAVELGSGEAAKEIGSQQKKIFQARENEDCTVTISVSGGGGGLKFKGFTIGSHYDLSVRQVSRTDTAIAKYARVAVLNYGDARRVHYGEEETKPKLQKGDSIAKFILKCVQQLEKEEERNSQSGESKSLDETFRKLQRKVNKKVSIEFKKLLQASEKTMGWKEAMNGIASGKLGDDACLRERVYAILEGGASGSFETTIMQLAEEFQCIYAPEWNAIGKLINRGDLVKKKKSLSLTIVNLDLTTTNGTTLFPVKYALVIPPQHVKYLHEPETLFIAVPKQNVQPGAAMIPTEGPLWISPSEVMEAVEQDGTKLPKDRTKKQKASQAKKKVKEKKNKKKKQESLLKKILVEYGKCLYVYQALSGSVATITTTLNFNIKVGQCYKVKNAGNGKEVLTGLLWEVRHQVHAGDNPQAFTQLVFSIVQMPGFTLPGV